MKEFALQPSPRRVLLDAALESIGEHGPRGLTMRAVARRARMKMDEAEEIFPSLTEIYLAIAEEGSAQLAEIMEKWVARGERGLERLHLCACGYVDFALRCPGYFALLFELPKELLDQRPCEPKERNAFGVMLRMLEQAQAEGDLPQGDPMPIAFPMWGMVHGSAKLAVNGSLRMPREVLLKRTRRASEDLLRGIQAGGPGPEEGYATLF